MFRWCCIFLLVIPHAAPAGDAAPATTIIPPRQGWRLFNGQWVRPAGEFRLDEIIAARIDGRRLTFAIEPSPDWKPKLISGRFLVAERLPDRSLWVIRFTRSSQIVPAEQRGQSIVLNRYDPAVIDADAAPQPLAVTLTPASVLIRGAGKVQGAAVNVEYQSVRDGTRPRLTVVFGDGRGYDVTGEDVFDLLARRPQVVRQFLSPLLSEVAGVNLLRPRPTDVYRVFDHIRPTADEMAAFTPLVHQLGHSDRAVREAASAELDALGAPAVLCALRIDLSVLTPEQAARLSDLIARNSLGDFDPAAAAGDLSFLREAMADPDRRVRDAARDQIEALSD